MIPPRDATEAHLRQIGIELDIVFDVDLGELVRGHHVIGRGIDLGRTVDVPRWMAASEAERQKRRAQTGPANFGSFRKVLPEHDNEVVGVKDLEPDFHYEFVPGLEQAERDVDPFFWYWMLYASDDLGTEYHDHNGGAMAPAAGGPATHGTRDIGGHIPKDASRLVLRLEPASGWGPTEPWRRRLVIGLLEKRVME